MPKFDKSNHLLTPKIGVVNLNPTNRSNETTNKGFINLQMDSIDKYVEIGRAHV